MSVREGHRLNRTGSDGRTGREGGSESGFSATCLGGVSAELIFLSCSCSVFLCMGFFHDLFLPVARPGYGLLARRAARQGSTTTHRISLNGETLACLPSSSSLSHVSAVCCCLAASIPKPEALLHNCQVLWLNVGGAELSDVCQQSCKV